MATGDYERTLSTILELTRKHGKSLLINTVKDYHESIESRTPRELANYLTENLGSEAKSWINPNKETENWLLYWSNEVNQGDAERKKNKLVCAVFNQMVKEVQSVVMEGPEAQLRYLVDKCGVDKTKKLMKAVTASN